MSDHSAFWEDLAEDLKDPEFLREFVLEAVRIKTVDALVNALDHARRQCNLSKSDLARAASIQPSTVRRFLTAPGNPTLNTVSELAATLGYRLTLEPLEETRRAALSEALHSGTVQDLAVLESAVEQFDRVRC